MKIRITVGDKVICCKLEDNPTAKDFVSLLPLSLTLEDYVGTEKISTLPRKLSTAGAPKGCSGLAGCVTYYGPWGNLAVFYRDYGYAGGLVPLGMVAEEDVKLFQVAGPVEVKLEMA